jgi:hypothetical protein
MSKKLIIVLNEKSPDVKHICNSDGCPFFTPNQSKNSFCYALWSTPPLGRNSLASLCNYYDTTDLHIIENTTNEELNNILDEIIKDK